MTSRDPAAMPRAGGNVGAGGGGEKYRRRWFTLAILSVALLIIIIDDTIINVGLPSIQKALNASASELQWIVDAYILVFAGLLLTMGVLGDRFGRKLVLELGLILFGAASIFGANAGSAQQLILARALMGVGGALIMPSTLSVIVDVFPAGERVKAIGIWTGVASMGIPLGPILSGWLLEQYSWGSIFLVNVPIAIVGLVGGLLLVPESRDPSPSRPDLPGLVLSAAALTLLVYGIIEAPGNGWTSAAVLGPVAAGLASAFAFIVHERRAPRPMLDLRLFRNARFSWGTLAVTLASLALTGLTFDLTQYLQIVQGYSPLQAGLRFVPIAIGFGMAGPIAQRLVPRVGTFRAASGGLLAVAAILAGLSQVDAGTSYWLLGPALFLIGLGVGVAFVSATEAVMGAFPEANAGLGSAINDASRQVGAALGIAILGSVTTAAYSDSITGPLSKLGPDLASVASQSAAAAIQVAGAIGGSGGDVLRQAAKSAFVDGFGAAMLVSAALMAIGAVLLAAGTRSARPTT